jgi:hypothetical protein
LPPSLKFPRHSARAAANGSNDGSLEASRQVKERTGKIGFGFAAGASSANTIWFLANYYWWSNGAALVVASAWVLLRETTRVLLEGAPRGLDVTEVEGALREHPAVEDVHHVHAWSLGSGVVALSAHVVVEEDLLLHDAQVLGDELKEVLGRRFGIDHATLELECHVCAPEPPAQPD